MHNIAGRRGVHRFFVTQTVVINNRIFKDNLNKCSHPTMHLYGF